ncbi:MAG: hypothetical protein M1378_02770 [Bacteroidetes bacterium]|nr:hypothetical protein [Bacteroidota bacterium]
MGNHEARLKSKHHIDPISHKRGEKVVWTCSDSDFRIWFPPEHNPLEPGPETSVNGRLERTVNKDAAQEEYQYSMYFFKDKSLAEGNSPPIIIIMR